MGECDPDRVSGSGYPRCTGGRYNRLRPRQVRRPWIPMRRKPRKTFHRCGPPARVSRQLRAWYRSPIGIRLLAAERTQLDHVLPNLFGYHLLQLGCYTDEDLLSASRIPHRMVMDVSAGFPARYGDSAGPSPMVGRFDALPVNSDALDVLVLPHVLEFSDDPHQVLREADRTLIPEGHLLLLGFNPWSLWQLWRFALGWRRHVPWCGRFLTPARIRDWLALLGFDIVLTRSYFFRPPLQHARLTERLRWLERFGQRWLPILGGGYVMLARKRVATLTPVRPRWRPRRRVMPAGVLEP